MSLVMLLAFRLKCQVLQKHKIFCLALNETFAIGVCKILSNGARIFKTLQTPAYVSRTALPLRPIFIHISDKML